MLRPCKCNDDDDDDDDDDEYIVRHHVNVPPTVAHTYRLDVTRRARRW